MPLAVGPMLRRAVEGYAVGYFEAGTSIAQG